MKSLLIYERKACGTRKVFWIKTLKISLTSSSRIGTYLLTRWRRLKSVLNKRHSAMLSWLNLRISTLWWRPWCKKMLRTSKRIMITESSSEDWSRSSTLETQSPDPNLQNLPKNVTCPAPIISKMTLMGALPVEELQPWKLLIQTPAASINPRNPPNPQNPAPVKDWRKLWSLSLWTKP